MTKESNYYTGEAKFSPVPLSVNSPLIKGIDKNKIRAVAVEAMHLQANQQMILLKKQAELIMQQVKEIEERLKISELIYQAEMRFKPVLGQTYHLYENETGGYNMSIIAPDEWGKSNPNKKFVSTVKLLGDYTWEVLDKSAFTISEQLPTAV